MPSPQVMALVMAPFLLEDPRVHDMFPGDAIARAREYLVHVKGGIGAYSDSKGNQHIRQEVWQACSCLFDVALQPWPGSPRSSEVSLTYIRTADRNLPGT